MQLVGSKILLLDADNNNAVCQRACDWRVQCTVSSVHVSASWELRTLAVRALCALQVDISIRFILDV